MTDILTPLNEQQKEAVITTEGYVRVIAGAGSGKTRALTHRYAYLVNDFGVSTSNILCVTFTNKAANEMKRRIRTMIGDSDTGLVCTFHGFCVQLLREDIHTINYPKNFVVLDAEDTETILKSVYEACHIESRSYTFDMARRYITGMKAEKYAQMPYFMDLSLERLKQDYESEKDYKKKIFLGYLYEQRKCFGLDYDDLIVVALYILQTFEEKRKKWQERMMYVMVDEFQDVSANQYELADILSGYHHNLFIVGDPDQTIYSWRYADVNHILNFDKCHEGTQTIILNRNYRSTPNIIDASNSLIQKNKRRIDKDLVATRGSDASATYYHAKTTRQEAGWIAEKIKTLVEGGHKYSDFAVLYRSHHVSRSVEEIFLKEKIPYILYSGVSFYQRKEIKDILSYLRMILYADNLSFARVVNEPKRNVGKKRMAFLQEYAAERGCTLYTALKANLEEPLFASTKADEFVRVIEKYREQHEQQAQRRSGNESEDRNQKTQKVSDILTNILNDSGYEAMLRQSGEQERLDNLSELKQSVFDFEKTSGEDNVLEEYLQNVALFTNADKEERKSSVKMMTIHSSKGLEFPYVFVCGMNEGIFPSKHVDTPERMEEERRMAYVACTRAENLLFLSDAEGTNFDGSFRYPSRFIFNVDKKYLLYVSELEEHLIEEAGRYIKASEERLSRETTRFLVGDRVVHKVLGAGRVIDIKEEISSYVIAFDQYPTERNITFKAPLTAEKAT